MEPPRKPRITLIAAVARNGVIGHEGKIPWRIPGDLPRFKAITMGHPVVMGRKTWLSLGRPLPGRRNIVISRSGEFVPQGAEVFRSLDDALAACAPADEVFVIGGTEAYRDALPQADRLLLTEIDADFEGDAFFPAFDRSDWQVATRSAHAAGAAFTHDYAYVDYIRKEREPR